MAEVVEDQGDGPMRITEIGDLEQIDTALHPVAIAVGFAAVVILLMLTIFAFSASLKSGSSSAQVGQVTVPRMAGRSLAEAQAELERMGLVVEAEYNSNEVIPADTVIGQDPVAGSRLEVGEQIILKFIYSMCSVKRPANACLCRHLLIVLHNTYVQELILLCAPIIYKLCSSKVLCANIFS